VVVVNPNFASSPTRLNILLVEDDPVHARLARLTVLRHNPQHQVFHVADGRMAINYLTGQGGFADRATFPLPDLVLLDLRLPEVDGYEVLKVMKSDRKLRGIFVAVITSSDRLEDIQRSRDEGADAFVTKPLTVDRFSRFRPRRDPEG
jgi:two-component system response regulator